MMSAAMMTVHLGQGNETTGTANGVFDGNTAARKGGVKGNIFGWPRLRARLAPRGGRIAGGMKLVDADIAEIAQGTNAWR